MKTVKTSKIQVCGFCAGAPRSKVGPFAAHLSCTWEACACRATGHIVTSEIATVQRAYTQGPAESDITTDGIHA